METCKSPRKVMMLAHFVAREELPDYASKFSRHDFTLAQLFACLVLREMLGLSYRGAEALLIDAPELCRAIGLQSVPDHATLCRAFRQINTRVNLSHMLERIIQLMEKETGTTLAIDSTLYDTHHRSRHYERRLRHHASNEKRTANRRRSRRAKRTPKLSIGIDVDTHLILSMKARHGMGSDAPDFDDLLYDAWKRTRITTALADAGFDSENNHEIARIDMGVRSLIKAGGGRPTSKRATGRYRRRMQKELDGSQAGRPYGQRAQAETAMSMLKRNLGDSLRSRTTAGQKRELMLKVVVHNLMIRRRSRGLQQSRTHRLCCNLQFHCESVSCPN